MSSSWIIQVGSELYDKCPSKRHKEMGSTEEKAVKMEAETGITRPQAKEAS